MAATSHEVDQFGQVEARGIDRVPADERHGKPSDLFWVWAASNVNYLYIVLGGLLMVFGLNVWQGLLVVVVGNLLGGDRPARRQRPGVGYAEQRHHPSMFGIRGNRVFTGVFNWPTFIAFEAINLPRRAGRLRVRGPAGRLPEPSRPDSRGRRDRRGDPCHQHLRPRHHPADEVLHRGPRVGDARARRVRAGQGGLGILRRPELRPQRRRAGCNHDRRRHDHGLVTAVVGDLADYARYLPADTSRLAVACWTAAGGFIPAVVLGSIGVLAGSVVDMADPQTSLAAILPGGSTRCSC